MSNLLGLKKPSIIKMDVAFKRIVDNKGFVSFSCSHKSFGNRKEARKHYMKIHLNYIGR
jgi:hypothetical protein